MSGNGSSAAKRRWIKANPDYHRNWRQANKERVRETNREWRKDNPEYAREYRKVNAEKKKKTDREWRESRPGYDRARYIASAEKRKEASRAWYWANREKSSEDGRRYRQNNPEKFRAYGSSYRASKLKNGGTFTGEEWAALCAKYKHSCLRCGAAGAVTVDHVVPLSGGGRNDIGNLQPLCKPCNSSKGTRTIDYRRPRPETTGPGTWRAKQIGL